MKSRIALVTAAVLFATSSLAFAAGMASSGTIKSVNAKTHMVMLDDGQSYSVAHSVDLKKFKAGEKVNVNYTTKNKKNVASSITPAS